MLPFFGSSFTVYDSTEYIPTHTWTQISLRSFFGNWIRNATFVLPLWPKSVGNSFHRWGKNFEIELFFFLVCYNNRIGTENRHTETGGRHQHTIFYDFLIDCFKTRLNWKLKTALHLIHSKNQILWCLHGIHSMYNV